MVHTLLVLSLPLLFALTSGVPTGEGRADGSPCVALPCPPPPCDNPHPTWYDHHGVQCPGCPMCALVGKRQLIGWDICPVVMCAAAPGPCSVPLQQSVFHYNSKDCPGCSFCPTASTSGDVTQDQKRQLTAVTMCLAFLCAAPGPCSVPLQQSVYHHNGRECPGCLVCPTASVSDDVTLDQKRQVMASDMCPMVMCASALHNPDPCSVPLQQSVLHHNGRDCPGCSFCPTASTSGDVTQGQKRQLTAVTVCPAVLCADPGPCSVPLQQSVLHHNGRDCPGCLVCPTASVSDDVTLDQKRQLIHLDICPIFECLSAEPCSVPLQQGGTIHINGKDCPACSFCPKASLGPVTNDQKRQLTAVTVCPAVLCANPGPCSVPLQQSVLHHNGRDCPGCLVCPAASMSDEKRQLIHLDHCPIIECTHPEPCSVPLQHGTIHINGKDCPACSFCPSASLSDVTNVQKRQLTQPLDVCPIFECVRPGPCSTPLQHATVVINGKACPACAFCPAA